MNKKNLDRAMVAAEEYARLVCAGRVAEAGSVRRTIDELVGSFDDGVWVWPSAVLRAAARRVA